MQLLTKWRSLSARVNYGLGFLLIILVFSSCGNDDPDPTSLRIEVNDASDSGELFSVVLYASLPDWLAEENPVGSGMTDQNGSITFSEGLEPMVYYVDVFHEDITNWHSDPVTAILVENQENEIEITVLASAVNYLVGKQEKSWAITGAEIGGFDVFADLDDCEKDDVLFFQRDDQLGIEDLGTVLCPEESSGQALFEWQLNSDESELTITDQNGVNQVFAIGRISADELGLLVELDLEGVPVEVLFLLEPIS